MSEPLFRYYQGAFSSQFEVEKLQQHHGTYRTGRVIPKERFRLRVEKEISREDYEKALHRRASAAVNSVQEHPQARHFSEPKPVVMEPHVVIEDNHFIELIFLDGKRERELASETYVEFQPSQLGAAYGGFEFIAERDGAWHGKLKGQGYSRIPILTEKEKEEKVREILARDIQNRKGCGPGGALRNPLTAFLPLGMASRGGCASLGLPIGSGGCLSGGCLSGGCLGGGCGKIGCGLLGLLLLLLLLLYLLKGCSHQLESDRGPRVIHDTVYVDEKSKEDIIKKFLDTTTISKTEAIELPNVQFYTGSAKLLPYSIESIQQLASYMNDHPKIEATIIGHTDAAGDAQANLALSEARAKTVREVLLSFGVAPERVSAMGRGESQPRASNETTEGRALNRRVEVKLRNTETSETKSSTL